MKPDSGNTTNKILPWEENKLTPSAPEVLDHLAAFAFPKLGTYKAPESKDTLKMILDIVEFFNPINRPGWLLLATNDYRVAEQAKILVAAAVCMSYRRTVHPVTAQMLLDVMKGHEDPSVLPFGVGALKRSGLIVFEDIDVAPKYFNQWKGSVTPFFKDWSSPTTSVFATTVHPSGWGELIEQEFMNKIGDLYGNVAKSIFLSKTTIYVHINPDSPSKPRRFT